MSIMVGTGHGAKNGVLIKKAEALETLEKVNAIVVDKTGTLTEGKPTVESVIPLGDSAVRTGRPGSPPAGGGVAVPTSVGADGVVGGDRGFSEEEILILAASLEQHSEHPLAAAIVAAAESRQLSLRPVLELKTVTGAGIVGQVDGRRVAVGSRRIFSNEKAPVATPTRRGSDRATEAGTEIYVVVDGAPVGAIKVADAVKPSAASAIEQLHRQNIQVIMMTGDNRATAEAIAKELGIDHVFAEVMPEDKASKVKELQSQSKIVAMAGDGVNDAPALAQADVGIAFASGTDVAIESADITLLKPDLDGILKARNLSRATMRNIRQNLFFAFIYNIVGVPIAAGVLFPVFGLLLSPMIASAAMTFSSVSVIMNALRLRNARL